MVARSDVELVINDPVTGERIIRSQETNLGDLCADAYRVVLGADIGMINGGGIRAALEPGDITYGDIIAVHPYGNMSRNGVADADIYALCLDALENSGNFYNLHKAVADDGCIVPILFGSYAVYATRGLVTNLAPSRDCVFFYTLGRTENDAMIPIEYGKG